MIYTFIAPIIVFAVIVIVHEWGHFITAKLTGMKVEEFAVGFGPVLWSIKKGETLYSFRIFPLGGFNKIMGMDREYTEDPRAFSNRQVWQRLLVISAGAICNIALAFIIFSGIIWSTGVETFPDKPIIGAIATDSPALKSGLQVGDVITSIDNHKIAKWSDILGILQGKENTVLEIFIVRDGIEKAITIIPEIRDERAVLGISPQLEKQSVTLSQAIQLGFEKCIKDFISIGEGLSSMILGNNTAQVAGPIGVARLAGTIANHGMIPLLMFVAILSLNLGFLNLLPIPLLDGGLLLLTILEGICRKPLPNKVLFYIQCTGIFILGGLFLYATINDITALFK